MPSPIQGKSTFRILMLHGYAQSSDRFRVKARLLTEEISSHLLPHILPSYPDGLEFIFADAPFVLSADDGNSDTSALESRAWWLNLDDVNRYIGLQDTLVELSESLHGQPIHAAVGFSQGGALTAMIAGLCDASTNSTRKEMLRAQGIPVGTFLTNLPGQEPLKFVVCISGFRGTMKYYSGFYAPMLTTPSMHIIAALDTMVADVQSQDLISVFEKPQVVYHRGGHHIPRDRRLLGRVGEFVTLAYDQNQRSEEDQMQSTIVKTMVPSKKSRPVSPRTGKLIMRRRMTSICTFGTHAPRFR
ncbi:hypothetical protein AbraIFM66951_004879 [Aspergillus brasiliensis]|uniref:Serine hydrolase domain-containing protein n=1 Tax=Aspergillus brasiliensis TaxID=319629 RepID=A0A9W5Z2C0_9EURO|nr:hypothetical protein AbraCBS73388_004055 [Aspergillus brasiliensis]GKZ51066.1 hypothetical protein AbraIFM66951_004879 [Aspergillus brasiliensis]